MADERYGEWAFLIGIVIAALLGVFALFAVQLGDQMLVWIYALLAILGLVVGLMNITEKETMHFLVSAIALALLPSALDPLTTVIPVSEQPLIKFTAAIGVFVAPAAFIVALKAIYNLAAKK